MIASSIPALPARWIGICVVVAMHALAIAALLSYAPVREALFDKTVKVSLITPPKPEPKKVEPPPPPEPPKPKQVTKAPPKPLPPLPILAAPVEAPTPIVVQAAPPAPPDPGPIAAAPAPAVVAVTPPNFSAAYLDNPAPAYPVFARRAGEQGKVILRVYVTAGGSAETVQVRTSSGSMRLDEAALETVKRWKFVPAKRGDEPVAAWVLVPISFRLDG